MIRIGLLCATISLLMGCSNEQDAVYEDNPELKAVESETEQVSVFHLQTGDCLIGTVGESVSDMDKIECSKPHLFEVYFTFNLPGGAFPGDAAIEEQADTRCQAEFEPFVGKSFEESVLTFNRLTPTADGWVRGKDREVICMIQKMDDTPRTGSAKRSGI